MPQCQQRHKILYFMSLVPGNSLHKHVRKSWEKLLSTTYLNLKTDFLKMEALDDCKPGPDFKFGEDDCGLVGYWENEISSHMVITDCKDGQIDGYYNSNVGDAKCWYILTGRYTKTDDKNPKAVELGWTVSWNNKDQGNSNSVTTWSGIYFPTTEKIHTQWILTEYQPPDKVWEASVINHDKFSRIPQQKTLGTP